MPSVSDNVCVYIYIFLSNCKISPCFHNSLLGDMFFKSQSSSTFLHSSNAMVSQEFQAAACKLAVKGEKMRLLFFSLMKVTEKLVSRQGEAVFSSLAYSKYGTQPKFPPVLPFAPPVVRCFAVFPRSATSGSMPEALNWKDDPLYTALVRCSTALHCGKSGSAGNYEWLTNSSRPRLYVRNVIMSYW